MKKVLSVTLAAAMATVTLAGCGGGNSAQQTTAAATEAATTAAGESAAADSKATGDQEPVTIRFSWWGGESRHKATLEAVDAFMKEYPWITVECEYSAWDGWQDKVATQLAGGTAPDLMQINWNWLYQYSGDGSKFVDLNQYSDIISLENFPEVNLEAMTVAGKLQGVPISVTSKLFMWQKTSFDKAGIEIPKTWDELRSVSKQVSKMNGDVSEMKGFEMIDTDALICNYLAMILQQGGQYLEEDDSINFATPEGIKAMNEIVSMVKDGECDLENLTAGEYCYNDVYKDKGYMSSVGSWAIGEGTDTYSLTYGKDFEYVPVPQYGEKMAFASETGWGLMVPKNSANQDMAWKFIEFFSNPDNLVEHNIACNQLPPRKSLLDSEKYKEAMPNISFLLDILPDGQWM